MSFEARCYDIAKLFLDEEYGNYENIEELRNKLAQTIQTTVEDFLDDLTEGGHPKC